jgi:hypothetical protein
MFKTKNMILCTMLQSVIFLVYKLLVIFVHKEVAEEILAKINNLHGKIQFIITH